MGNPDEFSSSSKQEKSSKGREPAKFSSSQTQDEAIGYITMVNLVRLTKVLCQLLTTIQIVGILLLCIYKVVN